MPLISKQPNAILRFSSVDILLVQNWRLSNVRFGNPKLDIIYTKCMRVNFPSLNWFFFACNANYLGLRSFFWLIGKAVVLPFRITFQRIDFMPKGNTKTDTFLTKTYRDTYAVKRAY